MELAFTERDVKAQIMVSVKRVHTQVSHLKAQHGIHKGISTRIIASLNASKTTTKVRQMQANVFGAIILPVVRINIEQETVVIVWGRMTTIIISVSTVSIIVRLVNFERIASGLKLEGVLLVPMPFPPTQCILPMVV